MQPQIKTYWDLVGGLSKPSKMPGYAYSLPATKCVTGSILHEKKGSVCEKCYALRGRYTFPNVQDAMQRRLSSLTHTQWVPAMVALIQWAHGRGHTHFRWHDSGDLQSINHLNKIKAVAFHVPKVSFWLPTREIDIVAQSKHATPRNLVIRESVHFIDTYYPSKYGNPTSTVHTDIANAPKGTHFCPASTQGGKCGACRACWDASIHNISYPKH